MKPFNGTRKSVEISDDFLYTWLKAFPNSLGLSQRYQHHQAVTY